ncbi:MAG: hypothetical protein IT262_16130 [Saprospiraceae bacterium]|nr:hypothetical protein [Saprospiraceae bacterium]
MNQKFFASLTGKYLRVLALLFVMFGAAQQISAQSLVAPTAATARIKAQNQLVKDQLNDYGGTETQLGLLYLRMEYYAIMTDRLKNAGFTTQQALDKGAVLLTEQFTKLPNTNITLTSGHVQTVMSETTNLLLN